MEQLINFLTQYYCLKCLWNNQEVGTSIFKISKISSVVFFSEDFDVLDYSTK